MAWYSDDCLEGSCGACKRPDCEHWCHEPESPAVTAPGSDDAADLNNGVPVVWLDAIPPGGYVCGVPDASRPDGICGMPVESEPCPEHAGAERDRPRYSRADLEEAYQYGLAAAPATAPATYPGPRP